MRQLEIDCGNKYGSADRFNIARPHAQGIDPRSVEAVDVTANVAIGDTGKYICPLDDIVSVHPSSFTSVSHFQLLWSPSHLDFFVHLHCSQLRASVHVSSI